jgi:hypothetical protein
MDAIDFDKLDVILVSGEYLDLLGSCNFKENDGSDQHK